MQGVAAKNDASYDLSRARASVTGQTTIAAAPATTSLNGRIVTALLDGALFLSAFLLFVLEPMVAKSILPTLGGTPMVWNTRLRGSEVVGLVEAEAARDDRFKWARFRIYSGSLDDSWNVGLQQSFPCLLSLYVTCILRDTWRIRCCTCIVFSVLQRSAIGYSRYAGYVQRECMAHRTLMKR